MKSSEMQISVYRDENDNAKFRYPKDWSADKVLEQIGELCATLQEELNMERTIRRILRYRLDQLTPQND